MLYSSIPTFSMVFVRKSVTRLPLVPYRANVTMLQDSLYVTDCYFAPVSHRHTSLQHNRSPKSIGGSLQGSLAITLTRLSLQADNSLQNTRLSPVRAAHGAQTTKRMCLGTSLDNLFYILLTESAVPDHSFPELLKFSLRPFHL